MRSPARPILIACLLATVSFVPGEGYFFRMPNAQIGAGSGAETPASVGNSVRTVDVAMGGTSRVGRTAAFTPTVSGPTLTSVTYFTRGALPQGLTLNTATGAITGAPGVSGSYSGLQVGLTGKNSVGGTVTGLSAPFTIEIAPPLTASVATVSYSGITGAAITPTAKPTATDALGSVTWGIEPGLPSGLSLSTDGVVSGKVSAPVTYVGKLVATDVDGTKAETSQITLTVRPATPLSLGVYGDRVAYTNAVSSIGPPTAFGGAAPYAYALVNASTGQPGTPPPGMAFSASDGTVSGQASATGTYGPYYMTVTDSAGSNAVSSSPYRISTRVKSPVDKITAVLFNGNSISDLSKIPNLPSRYTFCSGDRFEVVFSEPVTLRYIAPAAENGSGDPGEFYSYQNAQGQWVENYRHYQQGFYAPQPPPLATSTRWRVQMDHGCYTGLYQLYPYEG